ncbi:MAG: hypothetical protein EA349_04920 [Halomonadaceae bacterium]|nr:MAG: hypothetical protein EA349_04920 [Halomonadaceae bacterium]
MKGLKKLALASAIAAVPFVAQAGMQPMNDMEMGNITGQAGVTIELEAALTIDQIAYNQGNNGSFLVDDIRVGGLEPGETLNIRIDIDLQDSGDAVISLFTLRPGLVEMGIDVGGMGLSGDDGSATLISNLEMDLLMSKVDITAQVENTIGDNQDSGSINIVADFVISNLDVDFDVVAVSLRGMRMGGIGSMDTLVSGDFEAMNTVGILNPVKMDITLGAGSSISQAGGGSVPEGDVLRINIDQFDADIWMPEVIVGPASIGSVAIEGLRVSDTRLAVYGR